MKERGYVPFNLTCTECSGNKCNGPTETNPGVSCYVCEECDEAFNSSVPLVKCSDWSTGCVVNIKTKIILIHKLFAKQSE